MKIINHGEWQIYQPNKVPSNAPSNTIFVRRNDDGMDWYEYVHSRKNIKEDTVKITCEMQGDKWIVMAAARDAVMLFPSGAMVLELVDCDVSDPQEYFGRKSYNPHTETFSDKKEF